MYAIVQVGSTQFKVAEGDVIEPNRLKEDTGKDIKLDKVLLFAKDSDIRIGKPYLKDVTITAKVVEHTLGNKLVSLKYRRTKDSQTKSGHRQKRTALTITKITA